jgi:hypothetical protein
MCVCEQESVSEKLEALDRFMKHLYECYATGAPTIAIVWTSEVGTSQLHLI